MTFINAAISKACSRTITLKISNFSSLLFTSFVMLHCHCLNTFYQTGVLKLIDFFWCPLSAHEYYIDFCEQMPDSRRIRVTQVLKPQVVKNWATSGFAIPRCPGSFLRLPKVSKREKSGAAQPRRCLRSATAAFHSTCQS